MTYLLAALAASGIFVAAGWRSKHARTVEADHRGQGLPFDPLWDEAEVDVNGPEPHADVGATVRLVLKRLAPVMTSLSVRAEVFSPAGLLVRMRSAALADLLEELLATVIHGAPASRLLLTATTHGDRIHVSITDDMPNVDPAVRQGSVRGLIERVALRGAALDVHVRPTEGTTMTLRLTAAAENRQDRSDTFPPQPPMQPSRGPNSLFSVPAQP